MYNKLLATTLHIKNSEISEYSGCVAYIGPRHHEVAP